MHTPTARVAPHLTLFVPSFMPDAVQAAALIEAKRAARRQAKAARAACDPAMSAARGAALAEIVLRDAPPPAGAAIAGFWPIGSEIDIRPLLLALHARGHPVALPVTPPRGQPLRFRLWQPGATLRQEGFGTFAPEGAEITPDWLLVPLLAFDRAGNRLGYGGGYYDRTLATLPGRFALGCGYAAQEWPVVPAGSHDMRLDAVATEDEVIRCAEGRR